MMAASLIWGAGQIALPDQSGTSPNSSAGRSRQLTRAERQNLRSVPSGRSEHRTPIAGDHGSPAKSSIVMRFISCLRWNAGRFVSLHRPSPRSGDGLNSLGDRSCDKISCGSFTVSDETALPRPLPGHVARDSVATCVSPSAPSRRSSAAKTSRTPWPMPSSSMRTWPDADGWDWPIRRRLRITPYTACGPVG